MCTVTYSSSYSSRDLRVHWATDASDWATDAKQENIRAQLLGPHFDLRYE